MKVVMSRVDERLVHGQVIASWSKIHAIKSILVIDDQLAKDAFMSTVLSMAAPSGVKVELITAAQAAERIAKEGMDEGANTMLLFKSPRYALELVERGVKLRELNIGNMGAGPARKAISKNVYATPAETDLFRTLISKGVDVYLQMVQQEPRIPIEQKL